MDYPSIFRTTFLWILIFTIFGLMFGFLKKKFHFLTATQHKTNPSLLFGWPTYLQSYLDEKGPST